MRDFIEGPQGRAPPPPFLIYDRHTSEGDRQNVHAFQARPMEGDSGNRLDGFGFGSIYGTRSGECIRSFKTKGNVSHVSFGFVESNLTSLRY